MKLIYFSFRYRHRQKELNNFLKSRFYGNFFILNLGGPFRYFLAKILSIFKIGKAISCDGRPLIDNESVGINFWMRGTLLDIPKNLRNFKNNYVTIYNPILKDNSKVFKILPFDIIKTKAKENIKIIYIAKTINENNVNSNIWSTYKNQLLNNFELIDDINFWNLNFKNNSESKNFNIYCDLKTHLRHEIISNIKKKYSKNTILVGNNWKKYFDDSLDTTYNLKKIKNLYRGNICIDLGSTLGSNALYSRSNQIIESGGLIIQSKQIDNKEIWKNLSNEIIFNNQDFLFKLLDKLINDRSYCDHLITKIKENFSDSKLKTKEIINQIFN